MWSGNEERRFGAVLRKASAFLLVLLLLPAFPGKVRAAEIVPDDEIEDSRYEYRTEEAGFGEIEVLHEFAFAEFIWKTREIRWHGEDRIVESTHTKYRKEISEGDPLVTLVSGASEIDIEEAERALQRKKEAFEQKKKDYDENRSRNLRQMNETQDAAAHDLLSLKIQREEVEFEKVCFGEERAIAEEEERISALSAETVVTAPVSGMVSFLIEAKDEKTVIHDGDVIARIRYAERLAAAVSGKDDKTPPKVHYGSRARFLVTSDGEVTETVTGTVIASNCIQEMSNNKKDSAWAMVVLDVEDPEKIEEILSREKPINNFGKMYYVERDLQNVLRVPRSSVLQDSGGSYVRVIREGDVINRRYVTTGAYFNDDWMEVLSGLSEGECVVTKERSY